MLITKVYKKRSLHTKRCSPPQLSSTCLLEQRQDGSCSSAAGSMCFSRQNKAATIPPHYVAPRIQRWWRRLPQLTFPIPEPKTMENNDGQTPQKLDHPCHTVDFPDCCARLCLAAFRSSHLRLPLLCSPQLFPLWHFSAPPATASPVHSAGLRLTTVHSRHGLCFK